ncbi:MAG: hypothetical protein HY898_02870 [Deltaproteobacteria bacterium]|nr:hypothetical protein [Deltaproteobacteria bacterium]
MECVRSAWFLVVAGLSLPACSLDFDAAFAEPSFNPKPDGAVDAPPAPDASKDAPEAGKDGQKDSPVDAGCKQCSGQCVPVDDPAYGCAPTSCSPCSAPHVTKYACQEGQCLALTCEPWWGDCDTSLVNGCETQTSSSLTSCGQCGHGCPVPGNGTATCTSGVCGLQCNSGYSPCGSTCANLLTDPSNCSTCGHACPQPSNASVFCTNGSCSYTCNAGLTDCSGDCVDLSTDIDYCGSCNNTCPAPIGGSATCVAGQCGTSCPGGQTVCGGTCTNTTSSLSNCGACGRACSLANALVTNCISGACSPVCNTGFTDCTKPAAPSPDDGCETSGSACP